MIEQIISDKESVERYLDLVSEEINLEIRGATQKRKAVFIRQVLMILILERTNLTLKEVGERFNRDHATVVHTKKCWANAKEMGDPLSNQMKEFYRYYSKHINLHLGINPSEEDTQEFTLYEESKILKERISDQSQEIIHYKSLHRDMTIKMLSTENENKKLNKKLNSLKEKYSSLLKKHEDMLEKYDRVFSGFSTQEEEEIDRLLGLA